MSERLLQPTAWYDVISFTHEGLEGSDEFALGMRDLRRRLPGARRWYMSSGGTVPGPSAFPEWSDATFVLVILNPALLISNNLVDELLAVATDGDATCCVLPSDTRGFTPGVSLDYASRPGFDRFVSRLSTGPRCIPFDDRTPWLYLVTLQALMSLEAGNVSWETLPAMPGLHTVIAGHAYIHSYADYYLNTRAEMLPLLPDTVCTLLDIGGGEGNFGRLFMDQRGGQATLLEQNAEMAAVARKRGLEVFEGDFQRVSLSQCYDCVTFLDVLEHMPDPLDALIKARQALKPEGFVLLSVPNVGHWSIVWDLLEGSFEYLPVGILCNTHLRFFTRASLEILLADAGFCVERWENVESPLPETFAAFLQNHVSTGVTPNLESLATASFHVLARRIEEPAQ